MGGTTSKDMGGTISRVEAAIKDDDAVVIKALIEQDGFKVDTEIKEGETSLILAARNDSKKVAKLLIEKGANVDFGLAQARKTALSEALYYKGLCDTAKLLIASGANVNALVHKISMGTMPCLFYAVDEGNKDLIELLIAKGAHVNGEESSISPLIYSIKWVSPPCLDIVKLLVEKGADVNYTDPYNRDALYHLQLVYKDGGVEEKEYQEIKKLLEDAQKAQAEKKAAEAEAQLGHDATVGVNLETSASSNEDVPLVKIAEDTEES